MAIALLCVDIQNDYFPGGAMELVGTEAAARNATALQAAFRERGECVVHVQHIAEHPEATFFRPGTTGVEIHRSVTPLSGEPTVVKHSPNAFHNTDLREYLRGNDVSELVVVGMMTHMCIDSTVRAASDLGFDVTLVADACATKALAQGELVVAAEAVQAAYLAAIDGSFARVVSTEQLIAASTSIG